MRRAGVAGCRSLAAVILSLWTLTPVAACGPRDSQESTPRRGASNSASLQSCQARVRCYDAIVKVQKAAVKKAALSQQVKLSKQLTPLIPANAPTTLRACVTSLIGLRRAASLLKARHRSLVKKAVVLLAKQLKDPDKEIRQAALVAIDDIQRELRRNRKDLNELDACKPFARHK